jgi:threonine dehydrogenase-like Zn-dependent dehydrogenase
MQQPTALWHLSSEDSALRPAASVLPIAGYCEIQTLYSLISIGTERLIANGLVPTQLYDSMKVPYMEGSFSFPVKYGYSLVGKVTDGPEHLKGKTVHLLHPHQDGCVVSSEDVFVVPTDVPPQRAILASNLETALNAIWDSGVSMGDKVMVVGFGLIGSLVARLLSQMPAVQVVVVEVDPTRIHLAQQMGFSTITAASLPSDFDLAFHCSSHEQGLQTCIDNVGIEGKIIEMSWYGNKTVNIQLGGTFHSQRKAIICSQVSALPTSKGDRWNFYRRKQVVFELLKDDAFDQHIAQTINFEKLPALFEKIRKGKIDAISYGIRY